MGIYPAASVTANGVNILYDPNNDANTPGWSYDGKSLSLIIRLPGPYATSNKLTVRI